MPTETELIRKLDFFEPLEDKVIKNIAKMLIQREFSAGDYIVKQGESGLGLYFITRGRAKVEIERDGTRVVVAHLQGGDFLGELSMIDDKARSADVVSVEDTSCMLLTRDSFSKLLNKHPQIAIQIAKSLVARIRATNERVVAGPSPAQAPPPAAAGTEPAAAPGAAAEKESSGSAFTVTNLLDAVKDFNPLEIYSSTKNKTRDLLVDLFGALYLMKVMTQSSAAIVGCPVRVRPEKQGPEILQTSIDGVKLMLFPASGDQVLHIDAFGDGEFSATVFRPANQSKFREASSVRLQGRVHKNDRLRLHVPADNDTWLETTPRGNDLPLLRVEARQPAASRHVDGFRFSHEPALSQRHR